MLRNARLPAYPVYLTQSAGFAFFFSVIATVNLVYQAEVAGLNPLQLVLVGTLLETVCFLCEVPTGIVADVYSRRLSVIVGFFLVGLGFVIEGLFPVFAVILLAQVIWGIGATFISGAEAAWIADEIGEARAGPAFLRAAQVGQIGGLLGAPVAIALGAIQLNLPILAGGVGIIGVGIFLLIGMPELGFRPTARGDRNSWQQMGHTFAAGLRSVRGRPLLVTLLVVAAVLGMASEGWDRLWIKHLLDDIALPGVGNLKPVVWVGVLTIGGMLLSLAATEVVRRRVDTREGRTIARLLLAASALRILGTVIFALAGSFLLAALAYWLGAVCRRVSAPLYMAWLNRGIEPSVRATVLSMAAQVDALGQIAGGPAIGWLGTVSLRWALLATAAALSPVLPLYARTLHAGAVESREEVATEAQ